MKRLCLFARTPRLGQVKKRLAQRIGAVRALAAHEALLRRSLERCGGDAAYHFELWLTDLDAATFTNYASPGLTLHQQPEGDLGQRMAAVLSHGLDAAEMRVLIGSDCPDIDRRYVRQAFVALARADVVLGPAEDGGYGLIGWRAPVPDLFADVPWGTSEVLAVTLSRAAAAGARVALLREIYDVDTPADWQRFLRATGVPSPETGNE